jgi:hypothetical protein
MFATHRTNALFLAAILALGCGERGSGPARIVVEHATLDLGEALPGEQLTGDFTIRNGGGAALTILKLQTGCDCAAAVPSRSVIGPGEEAVVRVSVHIKREGQYLLFPVKIESNDPDTPVAEYRVSAHAAAPVVRTEPKEADFGELARGTESALRIKLLDPENKAWPHGKTLEAACSGGVTCVKLVRDGDHLIAELRPRADLPLGDFADTLVLKPADSTRTWTVPVRGRAVPKFMASPTAIYFGDVGASKEPIKRTVLLKRTDGQPWPGITKTTAPGHVRVDQEITASRCLLRITLLPETVKEDLRDGKIEVWLEGESEPVNVGVMIFRDRG